MLIPDTVSENFEEVCSGYSCRVFECRSCGEQFFVSEVNEPVAMTILIRHALRCCIVCDS